MMHSLFSNDPQYEERPAWRWLKSPATWAVCCVLILMLLYAVRQQAGGSHLGNNVTETAVQVAALPTSMETPEGATATLTLAPTCTPTPAATATATSTPQPVAYSPPTRICIPKINVDADVLEVGYEIKTENGKQVTVWKVADFAAGFHSGSAYPGHPGNTIIAAHNNIRGRVFRHLVDVLPGDDIYLYVGELEFHYVVSQRLLMQEKHTTEEIRRENARWIEPTSDERLTLVSCWPFISPDHRVVVIALPPEEQQVGSDS